MANALSCLFREGKIDDFTRSRELDRKGIDFLVFVGSKRYKLSVKSSKGGVDWEKKDHPERMKRGDLIFVVPVFSKTNEELASGILEMISEFEEKMHQK